MEKAIKIVGLIIIVALLGCDIFLLNKTSSQHEELLSLQQTLTQLNQEKKDMQAQLEESIEKNVSKPSEEKTQSKKSTKTYKQENKKETSLPTNEKVLEQTPEISSNTQNKDYISVADEFSRQLFTFKADGLEAKREALKRIATPSIVNEIVPESMIQEVKKQATSSTSDLNTNKESDSSKKEASNPYFETEVNVSEVYLKEENETEAKALVRVGYQTKNKNNLSKTISYVSCTIEKNAENQVQVIQYKVLTMNE
ncbi:MAG: hypothetical protein SOR80_00795 [Enterococcus cecorum]|uniref:Lipoprotein n=1 Tax=Enterococcus cecorum TaxID=44008 RepID=A0A7X9NKB8_9ENTE|nr:hypothetical protein [Enterococcus cecorum]MDY2954101.1 hypothetical protein [Enterococcus cecorum]NME48952.1 hypothetical protein [Enterococcus cecorum]CAI3455676.1 hypothetical protein CIRMBP1204_02107 [Enterococcus cecorum]